MNVGRDRPDHRNTVAVLAVGEDRAIRIARVDQVLPRQEVRTRQRLVDRREHFPIRGRRHGGFDVGDQEGRVRVAGLRDVHFVANPGGAALVGVARFGVVGGVDPARGGREILLPAPAHDAVGLRGVVLLEPHLAKHRDGRQVAEPGRVVEA